MIFPESKKRSKYRRAKRKRMKDVRDRIAAYMVGELDDLEPNDKVVLDRWFSVWSELENGLSPAQAVKAHMNKQELKGEEICRKTAYLDLKNSTDLWGDVQQISRKAHLVLLYEMALAAYQQAKEDRDTKEMNRAISNLNELAKQIQPNQDEDETPKTFILQVLGKDGNAKQFDLNNIHGENLSDQAEIIDQMESEEFSVSDMDKLLTSGPQSFKNDEDEEEEESGAIEDIDFEE